MCDYVRIGLQVVDVREQEGVVSGITGPKGISNIALPQELLLEMGTGNL